jgi:hypothetical protein
MKFFLDIDGVMVHANPHKRVELDVDGFYKFNRTAVEILNAVINVNRGDELILSTSHRFRFNIIQWQEIFKTRGVFISHLSIIDIPLKVKSNRKTEIINWITIQNFQYEEIVIIDDDKSLNDLPAELKSRLVLTNSYTGLDNLDDIKKIIKQKKRYPLSRKKN